MGFWITNSYVIKCYLVIILQLKCLGIIKELLFKQYVLLIMPTSLLPDCGGKCCMLITEIPNNK
jgi:hypothetical protein